MTLDELIADLMQKREELGNVEVVINTTALGTVDPRELGFVMEGESPEGTPVVEIGPAE